MLSFFSELLAEQLPYLPSLLEQLSTYDSQQQEPPFDPSAIVLSPLKEAKLERTTEELREKHDNLEHKLRHTMANTNELRRTFTRQLTFNAQRDFFVKMPQFEQERFQQMIELEAHFFDNLLGIDQEVLDMLNERL